MTYSLFICWSTTHLSFWRSFYSFYLFIEYIYYTFFIIFILVVMQLGHHREDLKIWSLNGIWTLTSSILLRGALPVELSGLLKANQKVIHLKRRIKHKVDSIVTVWNCEAALNDDPKKFWLYRDMTPDISDTGVVLHHLCYKANWEMLIVLLIGFYCMI